MTSIGSRVRMLREERGMSQAELARRSGLRQPSLWAIENGKTKTLKAWTVQALSDALTTTTQFLLVGEDRFDDASSVELDAMESELLAIFRSVTPDKRIALMEYARFIHTGAKPEHQKLRPADVRPIHRPRKQAG